MFYNIGPRWSKKIQTDREIIRQIDGKINRQTHADSRQTNGQWTDRQMER